MTSPVYCLQCGGHTQVRLSELSELAREEGGSVLIAHVRDIQLVADNWIDDDVIIHTDCKYLTEQTH